MRRSLILAATFAFAANSAAVAAEPLLETILELPGNSIDLTKTKTPGANINRNGFFSDIFYDSRTGWYALSDRGPGGGLLSYGTRVQRFSFVYDANGDISDYKVTKTIRFTDENGAPFNGLNPGLLNLNPAVLGNSFDPEGIVVGQGGHLYVSDEYGPSVYEFSSSGQFIRAFDPPSRLLPRVNDALEFVADPPQTGRQGNRGYEGLAINPLKTKLYAILQDPLQEEGLSPPASPANPGRRSRNVRIVEYDIKTGQSERQFIYQLDTLLDINGRDPSATQFPANQQGRSIGASSIYAISNTEFLVLERDNRGRGVDAAAALPTAPAKPLHKRIYKIDISEADDFADVSLVGINDGLPDELKPVSKELFLDLLGAIGGAGHWLPEKLEGFAVGPLLPGGKRLFIAGTDNDYSVTQSGAGEQFDICIDSGMTTSTQVTLGSACPAGKALIPALLMSFTGELN